MGWPEISIEDFPPKRDDEPSSLRRDIIDELTDHFACAFNRELLKNPDEQLARQRVIIQFGDPVKIARQLWLDAMKEKIMSQRIMTGISVAMAVCCMLVVGIAWVMMKESHVVNHQMLEQLAIIADRPQADSTVVKSLQRTNEAIVRELKILAESQRPSSQPAGMGSGFGAEMQGADGLMGMGSGFETKPAEPSNINQQILNQLEQLNQKSNRQSGSTTQEMNQISFQLVQDKEDGKPAVGFTGKLTKIGTDAFSLNATSDKKGTLDFGKLPWGRYDLSVKSPWDETCQWSRLTVIPGRKFTKTLVCPATAPQEVSVQFQVNMPEKYEDEWRYLLCDFRQSHFGSTTNEIGLASWRKVQGLAWSYYGDLKKQPEQGVYLIDIKNNQVVLCPLTAERKFKNIDLQEIVWQQDVKTRQGQYGQPVVYLLRENELPKLSELNTLKIFGVLSGSQKTLTPKAYTKAISGMFLDPFKNLKVEPQLLDKLNKLHPLLVNRIHAVLPNQFSSYIANVDQSNLWEINIPSMELSSEESGSLSSAR